MHNYNSLKKNTYGRCITVIIKKEASRTGHHGVVTSMAIYII